MLAAGTAAGLLAAPAAEAAPWVYRAQTLSRSDWALGLGLGIGHDDASGGNDPTGMGLNLETKVGLTSLLQLGLRTGVRFGNDGKATRADQYGRPFETETYGTGHDGLANPEVSLRWGLVRGRIAELSLDTRMYLPIEEGTEAGIMIGLPMAFHIGGAARLDTGIFVPIIFGPGDTHTVVSLPLHLWFQVSDVLALGPMTGVRFQDGHDAVPFGFGLAYATSYDSDLKTWMLFPDVSGDGSAKSFGFGVGLEIRF